MRIEVRRPSHSQMWDVKPCHFETGVDGTVEPCAFIVSAEEPISALEAQRAVQRQFPDGRSPAKAILLGEGAASGWGAARTWRVEM